MSSSKTDKAINTLIMCGMVVSIVIATVLKIQDGGAGSTVKLIVTGLGAMFGIVSTVLAANGNILTFLFGILDMSIYTAVLIDNAMWAQTALRVLYSFPMQIIGFLSWRKRNATAKKPVAAERLKPRGWLLTVALFVLMFVVCAFVSHFIGKGVGEAEPLLKTCLDAVITSANIVALVLMSQAYLEQWYLWIVLNVSSMAIWLLNINTNPDGGYTIVIFLKYLFYLLNCINAIRIWLRLSSSKNQN